MKVRTENQRACYKLLFILVKYLPIISATMLWIHTALALSGIDDTVLDHLFDSSIPRCLLMLVASYAFGFCMLHRHYVLYNLIFTLALSYSEEIGFSSVGIVFHQWIFLISGFILLVILIIKWKQFVNCCGNADKVYRQILKDSGR